MATMRMLLAAAVAFLIGCTNVINMATAAGYYREAPQVGVIHVGGQVLCQDCFKSYREWINGSSPLKGVKVGITCMDERSRVMWYESDDTDEQGRFNMVLDKFPNAKAKAKAKGKELKINLCSVRLVSSSHPVCNIATDFAGGKTGVKLMRPISIYNDIVKYRVGPFYYTTPMCEKPYINPSESDEDQGSNY